jgi:hypothetical protein
MKHFHTLLLDYLKGLPFTLYFYFPISALFKAFPPSPLFPAMGAAKIGEGSGGDGKNLKPHHIVRKILF